jgi:hypothetical protein
MSTPTDLSLDTDDTPLVLADPAQDKRNPRDTIPFSEYGLLASAVALEQRRPSEITAMFGVTDAALGKALDDPIFKTFVRNVQAQLREHGSVAAFVAQSQFALQELFPHIRALARSPETDAAIRLKVFETLARFARLDPMVLKNKADAAGSGVNITLNVASGISGLNGPITVDAQAVPASVPAPPVEFAA